MEPEITIIEEKLKENLKWKHFYKSNHIKSGTFGSADKYVYSKSTQIFAVKTIEMTPENDEQEKIMKETTLLDSLSEVSNASKYFPIYYGYVKYSEKKGVKAREYYALVFELGAGNLKNLVEFHRADGLSFKENMMLLDCFARGLAFLQGEKVSHRDIKPDNIVFFEVEPKEEGKICFKIIDFGEVKIDVDDSGSLKGSPLYFAPEVSHAYLNNKAMIEKDYNPYKSDVYSVGLIFLFVNLIDLPFPKKSNGSRFVEKNCNPYKEDKGPFDDKIKEMIERIFKKFEHCKGAGGLKAILKKCLQYNPKNRIDFLDLKNAVYVLKAERESGSLDTENTIEVLKKSNKILTDNNQCLQNELEEWKKKYQDLEKKKSGSKIDEEKKEENKIEEPDIPIVQEESYHVFFFSNYKGNVFLYLS